MSLGLQFKSNGELVVREAEELAERIADPREVLEDFGEHMVNTSIPRNFEEGGRPDQWAGSDWQMGSGPNYDRGRLVRSIRHEVSARGLRVGTNLRYARQRHFGGELRPTRAKALVVPLPGLTRSMRRPSRWGDRLFRVDPKSGDADTAGVLATSDRSGKVTPRFVLRRRVTQPARPFLLFQDEDVAYLLRQMAAYTLGEQG